MARRKPGEKKRIKLYEALQALFIKNESLEKKYTDEQLKEILLEYYPEKEGRSTLDRISMFRGDYNNARGIFRNQEKAGTKERPISFGYNEDGTIRKRGRFVGSKNKKKRRSKKKKVVVKKGPRKIGKAVKKGPRKIGKAAKKK